MSSSSAEEIVAELRAAVPLVGPSLLASDFLNLEREVRRLEEAGLLCAHKSGAGRNGRTAYHLAPAGRMEFEAYLADMEYLLTRVRNTK